MQARDDPPGNGPPKSKPSNLGGPGSSTTSSDTSTATPATATGTDSAIASAETSATTTALTAAIITAAGITPANSQISSDGVSATASSTFIGGPFGLQTNTQSALTATAESNANLGTDREYTGRSMSNGAIAAAVVVPLLLIALVAAALLLFRRRRRQQDARAAAFVQNMTQQPPQPIHEHYNLAPIAAGVPIAGYFTGLDTSDNASHQEAFSDEPPPPYGNKAAAAVPLIVSPVDRSTTESSLSWRTAPHDTAYLGAADAERQSITSTAYSDNASVHSARAARMSVGGAHVITTAVSRDPFDDPESPVSSVDGEEARALHGSGISRVVSPVSFSPSRRP